MDYNDCQVIQDLFGKFVQVEWQMFVCDGEVEVFICDIVVCQFLVFYYMVQIVIMQEYVLNMVQQCIQVLEVEVVQVQ